MIFSTFQKSKLDISFHEISIQVGKFFLQNNTETRAKREKWTHALGYKTTNPSYVS